MRVDGNTIRGHEAVTIHLDLESLKAWAKTAFTKERVAEAGVIAATMLVTGYVALVLYKGIETYSISGF